MTTTLFAEKIRVVTDDKDDDPITIKITDDSGSSVAVYLTEVVAKNLLTQLQRAMREI